jgi:hypothetical protein
MADTEKFSRVKFPGYCIGDFSLLAKKKYKRVSVMALEYCKVIMVNLPALDRKIKAYI